MSRGFNSQFAICNLQFAMALFLVGAAHAQSPEIAGIRVGFADRYKLGAWTPVEVTLRGAPPAGQIALTMPDSDGVPTRVTADIAPNATRATLYARIGLAGCPLKVELLVDSQSVARKTFEAADRADGEHYLRPVQAHALIVQVGAGAMGLEEAVAAEKTGGQSRAVVARVASAEQLPTQWYGYEGADVVVLSTSDPAVYQSFTPESEQAKALDQWVRMGGKLVLCVGLQGEKLLKQTQPLAAFAPGTFKGTVPLPQTSALETYGGSSTGVPGDARAMLVVRLADVQGKIEAAEGDLPLVVRTPRGFGQILFVAADLDQPPLSKWADRKLLAARLLELPASETGGEGDPGMHYGFTHLSGQLRSALDQFQGVRIVPFAVVASLIVVYILLIGPGDYYFFLRRFLRRMEWTWATFPAIVLFTCAGAAGLAYWLKGSELRIHQAEVIDFDAASGTVRGTSWMNVFSPCMENFNFSLRGRLPDGGEAPGNSIIAWLGLHGDGLGGMNRNNTSAFGLESEPYRFSPALDAMQGVPIPIWSTKSFTARWSSDASSPVEAKLADEEGLPAGRITNSGGPLENCVLAYEHWAYELGTIATNATVEIGPTTRRVDLRTLLTGRKYAAGDKNSQEGSTPYDQSSVDVDYILRAIMFYEAAGGQHYTHLTNDDQRFLDMTSLLRAGRAVLVAHLRGVSGHSGTGLLRDGQPLEGSQDEHTKVYRFVLPVEARKSSQ
jgi:hypothetical protein